MTLFVDTETTGFVPGQICQLSFIAEDNGQVCTANNYFFSVDHVDKGAEETHGLSVEKLFELSSGKRFQDYKDELYKYFEGADFVAHNAEFDKRFIGMEFWRCNIMYAPASVECTMKFFKDVLQIPASQKALRFGKYKNPNLEELVNYFNIDKDKIIKYSKYLFGSEEITFHDSRFDTTAMYTAVNVYREKQSGQSDWTRAFCN